MKKNKYLGSFPDVISFDPERISEEIDQRIQPFEDELSGAELKIRAVWIFTDGILRVVLSAELRESQALLGFEAIARGLLASRHKVDEGDLASLFIVECLAGENFPELITTAEAGNILWVHPILEIARPKTLDEVQAASGRVHVVI